MHIVQAAFEIKSMTMPDYCMAFLLSWSDNFLPQVVGGVTNYRVVLFLPSFFWIIWINKWCNFVGIMVSCAFILILVFLLCFEIVGNNTACCIYTNMVWSQFIKFCSSNVYRMEQKLSFISSNCKGCHTAQFLYEWYSTNSVKLKKNSFEL